MSTSPGHNRIQMEQCGWLTANNLFDESGKQVVGAGPGLRLRGPFRDYYFVVAVGFVFIFFYFFFGGGIFFNQILTD